MVSMVSGETGMGSQNPWILPSRTERHDSSSPRRSPSCPSFPSTKSPRMITSELRISLQYLALHASKIPHRFLRFKVIDHCLSMTRLKGRAKQVQTLQNQLTCFKQEKKYIRQSPKVLETNPVDDTRSLRDGFRPPRFFRSRGSIETRG